MSVGAIYYYFDSKAELTGAAVASIWQEIFHLPDDVTPPADTKTCILWICERIKEGNEKYPGFFTLHSLGFLGEEKADGKRRMQKTWHHILDILTFVIRQDPNIRPDTFTEQFTPCLLYTSKTIPGGVSGGLFTVSYAPIASCVSHAESPPPASALAGKIRKRVHFFIGSPPLFPLLFPIFLRQNRRKHNF